LRPELERAIEGLKDCQKMMEKRNEPPQHWQSRGEDKQAALAALRQQLNELIDFLKKLGDQVSGLGWQQLVDIEKTLKGNNKDDLDRAVLAARKDSSDRTWLDLTIELEAVGIELRDAFR